MCRDYHAKLLFIGPVDSANQVCILVLRQCMELQPGRLIIEVNMERGKKLRELGLAWTKITETLYISRQTYHCLDGSGLMGYSEVSDQ